MLVGLLRRRNEAMVKGYTLCFLDSGLLVEGE